MENKVETMRVAGEQKTMTDYNVIKLAPEGLRYGKGGISVEKRLADPEDDLTPEIMGLVEEEISSGPILIPISRDKAGRTLTDDGCGDGRAVNRIMRGVEFLKKSYNRAKVFGGGLTMGVAAEIGLGKAKRGIKSLYKSAARAFRDKGLDYGAHTDEGSNDKKCGCGAIDNAPAIVGNVDEYREFIKENVLALGEVFGETDEPATDEVISNFIDYDRQQSNEDHSGTEVMEVVAEEEKVVKELDSKLGHREVAIVLNLMEGMTVDQEAVRRASGGVAQVFAVDVPRLYKIANRRYNDPADRKKAVLSMLVYTLSTAATLTDGTLPVYVVKQKTSDKINLSDVTF
ncbi:MAG TPA: hypothetical protein VFX86_01235 [Candidatus Saccharimonadales bacterium]|nr:hypothetical protein [Candidatus Saccharimonadales bacterium]